jgi:hypothetical protein
MRDIQRTTWVAGFLVWCLILAPASGQEVTAGEVIDLPNAGVNAALPAEATRHINTSPYQLLGGTLMDDEGNLLVSVALLAYPTHPNATAEEVADNIVAQMNQDLAFRQIEEDSREMITMGGLEAEQRVISYTYRGEAGLSSNTCALRHYAPAGIDLCYVLKVDAPAENAEWIAPVVQAVLGSITFDAITPAACLPVGQLGEVVSLDEWGYTVSPPEAWCVSTDIDSGSIYMGMMDHTLGGEIMPAVLVVAADIDAETTAESCVESFLTWAQDNAEITGTEVDILVQGPACLAGQAGQQVVLLQRVPLVEVDEPAEETPAAQDAAPADADSDSQEGEEASVDEAAMELDPVIVEEHLDNDLLVVYRVICVPARGEMPARSYSMTLICDLEDTCQASAFLDEVARGVSLLEADDHLPADTCFCDQPCCEDHEHPEAVSE